MMTEKALRLGTAGDEQFTEFVDPAEANIKVEISSDIRQVGKQRLMHAIRAGLLMQGYSNVTVTDEVGDIAEESTDQAALKEIEAQKQVRIDLVLSAK